MQITVQLEAETAHQLRHRQPPSGATRELLSVTGEFDVKLQPVHPGMTDPELAKYYSVEVADGELGDEIRAKLARCQGVEAAYVKPADELA